jgi:hypothetical protein
MRLFFIFCYVFIPLLIASGQFIDFEDAVSAGMAGAGISAGGHYVGAGNPASLVTCRNLAIGIHYYNRFMLIELDEQSLDFIYPAGKGSFAGGIGYFGTKELNRSRFRFSYGHKFSPWLYAGIDLNYHHLFIQSFRENRSAITGNLGIIVMPVSGLLLGCYYININPNGYHFQTLELTATALRWGISYTSNDKNQIAADFCWTNFQALELALGTEIFLTENLVIRGGIRIPAHASYSFGMGILLTRIQFNVGFSHHVILGLSSTFSLTLPFYANGKE